jgi:hypothetical protein
VKILYKDFISADSTQPAVPAALDIMNVWIRRNNADVVNVETLLNVCGEFARTEQRGIRCWYREQDSDLKKPL